MSLQGWPTGAPRLLSVRVHCKLLQVPPMGSHAPCAGENELEQRHMATMHGRGALASPTPLASRLRMGALASLPPLASMSGTGIVSPPP